MMTAKPFVALLLSFSFLLSACGGGTSDISSRQGRFTPEDYPAVYKKWTRDADAFSFGHLHDVLNATATYLSEQFRSAYVVRYAHDHGFTTDEREKLRKSSIADAKADHSFFVTLAGLDYRESDLTSERSAWRVVLVSPTGRTTVPSKIERIRKPTPAEQEYFPSVSPFRHTFRLSFPRSRADGTAVIGQGAEYFILRFAGPDGIVDLRWDFQG